MNKAWLQTAWAIVLIATGECQSTSRSTAPPADWKTYHSPEYGFTIEYPSDMTFSSGRPVAARQRSMIPVCADTAVACFEYNGHAFDRTVIESLGLSINILRDERTEADCADMDDIEHPSKSVVIHGTRFHFAETGSAATGHSEGGPVYHAFHQHVCFEIALGTARTDIGPVQYEEAGIHPIDEKAMRMEQGEMNRMLQSFTFVGRVRDGGAWNRYDNPDCGGSFEYPSDTEIEQVTPYTPQPRVYSPACSVSFVERGRVYTIAEKENLRNQGEINDWLSTSAFPDLAHAKKIGNKVLEYRSSDLAYFVVNGKLFLFAVSNAAPQSPRVRGDAVFAHLLKTFRWP